MQEIFPFDGYEDLYNRYDELPTISFDYAVAEKEEDPLPRPLSQGKGSAGSLGGVKFKPPNPRRGTICKLR